MPSLVQATSGQETVGGGANSLQSGAFGSSVANGDTIVVQVNGYILSTPTTVAVSDTEGNTYTCDILNAYNSGSSNVISSPGSNNVPAGVSWTGFFRASNVTGGSGFKVTVTLGGGVNGYFAISAYDINGAASASPVDVTSYNAGASGSPSTGTFTTTYPTDLVLLGLCGLGGVSAPTFTAPSGYTDGGAEAATSTPIDGVGAYQFVSAVQSSINPTWTVTNFTDWVTATVAYKADLIVQSTSQASTSSASSLQTSAFGSSVTTGNTVIVTLLGAMGSTAATISISDTESNMYTCDLFDCYNSGDDVIANPGTTNVPASKDFVGIWHASNVTGGSSFKVTATIGGSNTSAMYLTAGEFRNLGSSATIDTSVHNAAGSGSNPTAGSFSTAFAHDLIVTGCAGSGATGSSLTTPWTSGWTSLCTHTPGGLGLQGDIDYRIVTSTQSGLDPTWTSSRISSSVAIAVAYEATAGGAPGIPSSLTVTSLTSSSVSLSWTQGSGTVTDNLIQYSTDCATWSTDDLGSAATSGTVTGLSPNTLYYFQVAAKNTNGTSAYCYYTYAYTGPTTTATATLSPVTTDILTTGWTKVGGASTFGGTLSDASDSTYVTGPASLSEPLVVQLQNCPSNLIAVTGATLNLRAKTSGSPIPAVAAMNSSAYYGGTTTAGQVLALATGGSLTGSFANYNASISGSPLGTQGKTDWTGAYLLLYEDETLQQDETSEASVTITYWVQATGQVGDCVNVGCTQTSGLVAAMTPPFVVQGGAAMRSRTW